MPERLGNQLVAQGGLLRAGLDCKFGSMGIGQIWGSQSMHTQDNTIFIRSTTMVDALLLVFKTVAFEQVVVVLS